MVPCHGNIFWVTGFLLGNTNHQWIPHLKLKKRGVLMISLWLPYKSLSTNTPLAGELRRYVAHVTSHWCVKHMRIDLQFTSIDTLLMEDIMGCDSEDTSHTCLTHLPQYRIHVYASVNRVGIGSDNGLSSIRRHAIIQTNAGLLSIEPLRTNFGAIWIKIQNFSFKAMHMKISSAKWRLFCPGEMS